MSSGKVIITKTTKELMTPAAPSVVAVTQKQSVGGIMFAVGLLFVGLAAFYWTLAPASEYAVLIAAGGCTLAVCGTIVWYLNGRAYAHLIRVVDTQTIEEREKPIEGPLVASLAQDPNDPGRMVGPRGVRLRVDQWHMIYEACEENGWKFSRPLIEKAIEETGIRISGLNRKYTVLHKWMLDMAMIIDTQPEKKNPSYRLTPKGVAIVQDYARGVEYAGRTSDV